MFDRRFFTLTPFARHFATYYLKSNIMNKLSYALLGTLLLFLLSACTQPAPTPEPTPLTESGSTSSTINTRSSQRIEADAYHYRSLARFKDGQSEFLMEDLAALQGKEVNFVLLYEAMAPWAKGFETGEYDNTGDDNLNGLMESYGLEIVKQFAIDDENEGLVLEPTTAIDNPIQAAKELSMIDHVLMVEMKEVPPVPIDNSTADVH